MCVQHKNLPKNSYTHHKASTFVTGMKEREKDVGGRRNTLQNKKVQPLFTGLKVPPTSIQ